MQPMKAMIPLLCRRSICIQAVKTTLRVLTVVGRLGDELPTVHHSDVSVGPAGRVRLQTLHLLDYLKARDDQPKHHVHPGRGKEGWILIHLLPATTGRGLGSGLCWIFSGKGSGFDPNVHNSRPP